MSEQYNIADVKIIAEHIRKEQHPKVALLLGAGTSVTAGIPLASGFVDIIEQRYPNLCRNCTKRDYPNYMALLSAGQRRDLIAEFVDKAKINLAHLALGTLVKAGIVDRVLTTNFDPLTIKTLALFNIVPSVYDFAASQIFIAGAVVDPSVFYLHGQRGGFVLLNTEDECQKHAKKLGNVFSDSGNNRIWIVVGYSGENDPVFERLAEIDEYRYKLFWVGYKDNEPKEHILSKILPKHKYGYYVKEHDSDSFFFELMKELQLPWPQIIKKPFSHLNEAIGMIADIKIKDTPANLTKETQEWIQTAIQGFEEGKGFKDLPGANKELIDKDEIIRNTRDIWLEGKYTEINKKLVEDVLALKNTQANNYLAYALNNWACELSDTAIKKKDKEAEELFEQAIEKFAQALKIKPDHCESLNNWGIALSDLAKQKQSKEAEVMFKLSFEKYEQALKIKPDSHEALNNWGTALSDLAKQKQGKEAEELFKQAIEKYAQALKIKPNMQEALFNWGTSLSHLAKQKQGKEAEDLFKLSFEKFEHTLKIDPDSHEALNNWGIALADLAKQKQGKEAEDLFKLSFEKYEQALKIKPDYREALHNWGNAIVYLSYQKTETEKKILLITAKEKCLQVEKIKEGEGAYGLACIESIMGNKPDSLIWLEKVLSLNTNEPTRKYIEEDKDLDNIRNLPKYKELLDKYRALK